MVPPTSARRNRSNVLPKCLVKPASSLSKRDIKKFTKGGKINIVDGGGGLNLALPAPFSHINIDVPRELCYDHRRAP